MFLHICCRFASKLFIGKGEYEITTNDKKNDNDVGSVVCFDDA